MKNKLILFVTGCILLTISSCLKSDDQEYEVIRDAQISSFSIKAHDSIPGLEDVKFTIDQLGELIYNRDSMPYGTELTEKVLLSIDFTSQIMSVNIYPEATGDTIRWTGSDNDTIDFTQPIKIEVLAIDGITKKTYDAQLNIHTVVGDTMVWNLYDRNLLGEVIAGQKVVIMDYQGAEHYFMYYLPVAEGSSYVLKHAPVAAAANWQTLTLSGLPAGGLVMDQMMKYGDNWFVASSDGTLYTSVNGMQWEPVSGLPAIKSILGYFNDGNLQTSQMALILEENNMLIFAGLDKEGVLTRGEEVPAGFPVSGFGNFTYDAMYYSHLMIVGGKDKNGEVVGSAWSTMNALYWAQQTAANADYFGKRHGVMVAPYDDKFYLIGGFDESGVAKKDIYYTLDQGISWQEIEAKVIMPEEYNARGYGSLIVDPDQFMLIFGGKTSESSNVLDEIWRGRINRLGFEN